MAPKFSWTKKAKGSKMHILYKRLRDKAALTGVGPSVSVPSPFTPCQAGRHSWVSWQWLRRDESDGANHLQVSIQAASSSNGNSGSRWPLLRLPVIGCVVPVCQPFPLLQQLWVHSCFRTWTIFFFLFGMFFYHQLTCCVFHSCHSKSVPSGHVGNFCSSSHSAIHPGTCFSLTSWFIFL